MISKFVFQSKNCNRALRLGVKIQNSILGQNQISKFFQFSFQF